MKECGRRLFCYVLFMAREVRAITHEQLFTYQFKFETIQSEQLLSGH